MIHLSKVGENMENTARATTTKGNKIRVNDIENLGVQDRARVVEISEQLVEYETYEDFTKAFPQSKNNQQFLVAQKKDDALKQQERDLIIRFNATEPIVNTAIGLPTPYMELEQQLGSLQKHKRYYILATGSKSKCEEYKKKVIKKQNRDERIFRRIETFTIAVAVIVIKEIITKMGWIINRLGELLSFLLDR